MIEVKNLFKRYGKNTVLNGIDFELNKGEIVGFIGPNGSGKSTTMKCMVGLVYPDKGEILVEGKPVNPKKHESLKKVSAMIEAPGLYHNLSGLENLKLFASLNKVENEKIEEIIGLINLGKGLEKKTKNYSMGMKQRLAFGITLLSSPDYLILDEPFNGLDPEGVFSFREEIVNLASSGCGILISSHQLMELEKLVTRKIFIKNRQLVDSLHDISNGNKVYKILLNKDEMSKNFDNIKNCFEKMKTDKLISRYYLNESDVVVFINNVEDLSKLMQNVLLQQLNIYGVLPVADEIEELYRLIYEEELV